ncbi:MAG: hypothetical protein ACRDD1_03425, partial [Planctomycetia bacterium]
AESGNAGLIPLGPADAPTKRDPNMNNAAAINDSALEVDNLIRCCQTLHALDSDGMAAWNMLASLKGTESVDAVKRLLQAERRSIQRYRDLDSEIEHGSLDLPSTGEVGIEVGAATDALQQLRRKLFYGEMGGVCGEILDELNCKQTPQKYLVDLAKVERRSGEQLCIDRFKANRRDDDEWSLLRRAMEHFRQALRLTGVDPESISYDTTPLPPDLEFLDAHRFLPAVADALPQFTALSEEEQVEVHVQYLNEMKSRQRSFRSKQSSDACEDSTGNKDPRWRAIQRRIRNSKAELEMAFVRLETLDRVRGWSFIPFAHFIGKERAFHDEVTGRISEAQNSYDQERSKAIRAFNAPNRHGLLIPDEIVGRLDQVPASTVSRLNDSGPLAQNSFIGDDQSDIATPPETESAEVEPANTADSVGDAASTAAVIETETQRRQRFVYEQHANGVAIKTILTETNRLFPDVPLTDSQAVSKDARRYAEKHGLSFVKRKKGD